jgi:hypothetical protein
LSRNIIQVQGFTGGAGFYLESIALFVIFLGVLTQLRVGPAVRLLDGADREILLELIMRR